MVFWLSFVVYGNSYICVTRIENTTWQLFQTVRFVHYCILFDYIYLLIFILYRFDLLLNIYLSILYAEQDSVEELPSGNFFPPMKPTIVPSPCQLRLSPHIQVHNVILVVFCSLQIWLTTWHLSTLKSIFHSSLHIFILLITSCSSLYSF